MYEGLREKLKKGNLTSRLLLKRFRFIDDAMRQKSAYLDPKGMPFYYYLGEELKPQRIVSVGGHLALEASCCALGAKSKEIALFGQDESRFAKANVKLSGAKVGAANWDLAIVFSDFCDHLDLIWGGLTLGGHLCVVNAEQAMLDFAKIKNRAPEFIKARDSVGLLRK